MIKSLFAVLLACPLATFATAQAVGPAPASSITELAAVNVSGVQPGPGLWKVSKGDHVLWILATLEPLPKKMAWQTDEVEQAVAGSQEVLGPPGLKIKSDVGFFGKLLLIPSLLKARKNPDGATLKDRVGADDYARWLVLKATYIGRDRGIERWRPIFAALELYSEAIKRSGLESKTGVTDTIRALASKHGVPVQSTVYPLELDDPRGAIKAFTRSGPDDLACFHQAVTGLARELPLIRARANAWAIGDIQALRAMPADRARQACLAAITEAGFARQLGLSQLPERVRDTWLAAADRTLSVHPQSFAVLPLERVIGTESVLPALRARGYAVTEPDAAQGDSDVSTDEAAAPAASAAGKSWATKPY